MKNIRALNDKLQDYYGKNARQMPWRTNTNPYFILVSEIMLQQTQVKRVIPIFNDFVVRFPTLETLAQAPQSQVVAAWSGLGYNRRARYLHQSAKLIIERGGNVPETIEELTAFPGVGPNTAGAIVVYAYSQPVVFIETNIRTVFIYEFFQDAMNVTDRDLLPLIEAAMDKRQPRQWYWAVMDYGTDIKNKYGNNIARSAHYKKQAAFAGSMRQLRGQILKRLLHGPATRKQLQLDVKDQRLNEALAQLEAESLILIKNQKISLVD